jgi:hypothetical protein
MLGSDAIFDQQPQNKRCAECDRGAQVSGKDKHCTHVQWAGRVGTLSSVRGQSCAAGFTAILAALTLSVAALFPLAAAAASPAVHDISDGYSVELDSQAGSLRYFVARGAPEPGDETATSALVVLHGHPRDAGKTLAAADLAARQAGRGADTLVIAPLFQVSRPQDEHCRATGVPRAQIGDALWTCGSWIEGAAAKDSSVTSFAALDQLLADLQRRWPGLRSVTVAGFSAGAQFVQHYIGFAQPPEGMTIRFVVSDPGTWLYFDAARPTPQRGGQTVDWQTCTQVSGENACAFAFAPPSAVDAQACPDFNRWKYGTEQLPGDLGANAQQARQRYAQADIAYLEGALDTGDNRGAFYKILDKSCGAQAQGPFRLQRGLAFLAYDQQLLSTAKPRRLTVVPGCAHDVSCVFPSAEAASALFPAPGN